MQAPIAGYYINLDRSPDRAAFMQDQLGRLGLDWVHRHRAVDGARNPPPPGSPLLPGEYACFRSHLEVLERAPADAFTLVLEDDSELCEQFPELMAKLAGGPLATVDLVFLECQPHYSLAHLSPLWDAACRLLVTTQSAARRTLGVELMDAGQFYKWGTGAYLVSPAGRARLVALLQGWLREGPLLPLDRSYELALARQELRGAITVPFLATTALQWQSTIGSGWRAPPDALMVLRRLLYAGSVAEAHALTASFASAQHDPALQMFGLVLREVAAIQRHEMVQARPAAPAKG